MPLPRYRPQTVLSAVLVVLAAVYLLQMVSPLRLNGDAITLLSLADSARAGHGFTYRGTTSQFPSGYPILIAGLDAMHLGASWSYIGLNCAFLAAGLAAGYRLLVRNMGLPSWMALLICSMTLLSYVFVKHTTLPISDIPFFGLCSLSLLALSPGLESTPHHAGLRLTLAFGLIVAATMVRTAGVSLVPVWLFAMYERLRGSGDREAPVSKWQFRELVLPAAMLTVLVGSVPFILQTKYFHQILDVIAHAPAEGGYLFIAMDNTWTHFLEYGEVSLNVPSSRLPVSIQSLLPYLGVAMLALAVYGIRIRGKIDILAVYLASYLLMLFIYVGYDARYWIPVVPLLMGMQAHALRTKGVGWRAATLAYCACFVLAGTAALGYSTRISVSGLRFADLYGSDALRGTYRAAFGLSAPGDEIPVNTEALDLLRRRGVGAR